MVSTWAHACVHEHTHTHTTLVLQRRLRVEVEVAVSQGISALSTGASISRFFLLTPDALKLRGGPS